MTIPFLTLFLSLLGSAARAQTPPAPVVTGQAIGTSSITWTWTASAGATAYDVLDNNGHDLSGLLSTGTLSFTEATTYAQVPLSTNTPYGVYVEAFEGSSASTSSLTTLYTLAGGPTGSALLTSGPQPNVVTLSWASNGNPAGTTYEVDWWIAASTPIVLSTQSVAGSSVVATVSDLQSGQTINLAVQAENGNGILTPFDVTLTTSIPALYGQNAISSGSYALGVSSIEWSWSASTGAVYYQLFSGTGGVVSPPLAPTQLSFAQTGLSTNTAYTDYVVAYAVGSSTNSVPFTQWTMAAPTTGLTLVSLATATTTGVLSWGANMNPPGTNYLVEWWSAVSSTITVSTPTTTAILSPLYAGSTLYFTVQSENGALPPVISTFDATYFSALTIPTTYFPVGVTNVPIGYQGVLNFLLPTAQISIGITSNTFAVPVDIQANDVVLGASGNPPTPSGNLQPLPSNPLNFQISACVGPCNSPNLPTNTLEPSRPLAISINYLSGSLSTVPGDVAIVRYDESHQAWIALATEKIGNTLYAVSDQLSAFSVAQVTPVSGLSQITVGPNPLRPVVNPGEVMTFRNLPPGARLRIFTYIGEKIYDVTADSSGDVSWDGRNISGSMVASGVYLVLIDGAGAKKIMRVAIER